MITDEWPIPKRGKNNFIRTTVYVDRSVVLAAKEIADEETERLKTRGEREGNKVSWPTVLSGLALGVGPDIYDKRSRFKKRKQELDKERDHEQGHGGDATA